MKIMGCEVIEMQWLRGMDIAIKQGDKLFVWPGFQFPSEFKYMEVPTFEETLQKLTEERNKAFNEQMIASWESKRIAYLFNRALFII